MIVFLLRYFPSSVLGLGKISATLETLHISLPDAQVTNVNTYCLHPGVVATELVRNFDFFIIPGTKFLIDHVGRFFIKTPRQGAQTSIHCAVDEQAGNESGFYYV